MHLKALALSFSVLFQWFGSVPTKWIGYQSTICYEDSIEYTLYNQNNRKIAQLIYLKKKYNRIGNMYCTTYITQEDTPEEIEQYAQAITRWKYSFNYNV